MSGLNRLTHTHEKDVQVRFCAPIAIRKNSFLVRRKKLYMAFCGALKDCYFCGLL